MPYNQKQYITFVALLKLWGVPPNLVEPISTQLANIDNDKQDELIAIFTDELQQKQNQPGEKAQ